MPTLAKHYSKKETPQSEPIPESKQVENSAGGFTFQLDDWGRLDRFLILGSDGGTYYASERTLTIDNAKCVERCLTLDGVKTVERIKEMSQRAPKKSPCIFALALAASDQKEETRKAAFAVVNDVCWTATQLFEFIESCKQFRSWGRAMRTCVRNWYVNKGESAGYQMVKYRNRNGWTHRDVLRCAHPSVKGELHELFNYAVKGEVSDKLPSVVQDFEKLRATDKVEDALKIVESNPSVTWEMIPTELLNDPKIWKALLPNIPYMALVRNLGRLSKLELTKPMSDEANLIVSRLTDDEEMAKSHVHPIALLAALNTYSKGTGFRGSMAWVVNAKIKSALDEAFVKAFGNVTISGKKTMLCLDVSGSMGWTEIAGIAGLTPCVGSAAMALVTARTEPETHVMAFSDRLVEVSIDGSDRLADVLAKTGRISMGRTDCSLPMTYAQANGIVVDTFVVYTDNETWHGQIHPSQALARYREKVNPNAKLVVVGMTATDFTIADPDDAGMLDVVGFDTATPNLIADFSRG
jgi:60 kDa SS-A/Ro ribonucleoprotein